MPYCPLCVSYTRSALLSLEVSKVQSNPLREDQQPQRADWELYIAEIARDIRSEQSPKQLYLVGAGRGRGGAGRVAATIPTVPTIPVIEIFQ